MKPYAWAIDSASRLFFGEFAQNDAQAEAARCGGTCRAFPLYRELEAGWKLVPLKSTIHMDEMGSIASDYDVSQGGCEAIYEAMLQAQEQINE